MENKLSIITVNLNNANGLRKTLRSIQEQTFKSYQLIVVDGCSTDESHEIAKNCTAISRLIHEKDNGIYHAMNKGIKLATGEWILFLNSGDYLHNPQVLDEVFKHSDDIDLLYGKVLVHNEVLDTWRIWEPESTANLEYLIRTSIPHQAMFFKRNLFTKYGLYREDLEIVSDWEFYTRIILQHRVTYKYVPHIISTFDASGISSISSNKSRIVQERRKALSDLFGTETIDSLENLLTCKDELRSLKKSRFIAPVLKLRATAIQLRNSLKEYFS